jgi:parallel beta-helix repeat protein
MKQSMRRKNFILIFALVLFAVATLMLPPHRVHATTTYYVAISGNDSSPGTQGSPFRTVQKAVNMVKPGDTVIVRAGRYAGFSRNNLRGAPGSPITIKAAPGEKATLDGYITTAQQSGYVVALGGQAAHLIIDGLEITNSDPKIDELRRVPINTQADCDILRARLSEIKGPRSGFRMTGGEGAHHMIFRNLQVHHLVGVGWSGDAYDTQWLTNQVYDLGYPPSGYGWYTHGENNLWQGNIVHDNAYGFHLFGYYRDSRSPNNNSIIENNRIYNNGTRGKWCHSSSIKSGGLGIYLAPGNGNIIRNNLIYNNNSGIFLRGNNSILNNTFYNNTGARTVKTESATAKVINNIFYNTARTEVSAGTVTSHNLTTDPKFLNAAAADFRLQFTSPAINAGVNLPEVPTDFTGVSRPQGTAYDIGAYESGGSTPPVSSGH